MGGKKKKGGKRKGKGAAADIEPEDIYMPMAGEQLEITITNLKE